MSIALNVSNTVDNKKFVPALDMLKGMNKNPFEGKNKLLGKLNPFLTMEDLQKIYTVNQDNMYYKCNTDISIQNVKSLNLNNPSEIRDFVTLCVNQAYLDDCAKRRVEPVGMIAVPEHLLHHVYLNIINGEGDKISALATGTDDVMERYTDDDGSVYFTCYYKQIKDAYETLVQYGERHKGELLPDYSSKQGKPLSKVIYNEPEEKCMLSKVRLGLAEEFEITFIPDEYKVFAEILVSNDMCGKYKDKNGNVRYRARTFGDKRMIVSTETTIGGMGHEKGHLSVMHNQWVMMAVCDFLFGITMGERFRNLSEVKDTTYREDEFYKYAKGYDPYQTKMPVMKKVVNGEETYRPLEMYTDEIEILSEGIGKCLTGHIILKDNKTLFNRNNNKTYTSFNEAVRDGFNELCNKYPLEYAALILSYMWGKFKE